MNQAGAAGGAETGDPSGTFRIDTSRQFMIPLAPIDIGGRRAVHDDIPGAEGLHGKAGLGLFRIGKIDLGAGERSHLNPGQCFPATNEGRAKPTIGTEDQNFHSERLKAEG
jgi:hypothetical protein